MIRRSFRIRGALARECRSCLRSSGGNVAVETALVMPVLLLVMVGIVQFGIVTFVQNNMMNTARETARRVAVGAITATEGKTWAESQITGLASGSAANVSEAGGDVAVTITAPLADIVPVDPFGVFSSGNLRASATARKEGV